MDASKVLSRLLPVAEGDEQMSVYEGFRRDPWRQRDLESQRVVEAPFRDDDDDPDSLLYDAGETDRKAASSPEEPRQRRAEDEDVPESLLLEAQHRPHTARPPSTSATVNATTGWSRTRERAKNLARGGASARPPHVPTIQAPDHALQQQHPQADAMWLYTNASNLDAFLLEVYQYFVDHGVWSMILQRVLGLLTELFVFSFAMFLTTCIDYSKIPTSKSTSEVLIPKCMAKASWVKNAATFLFIVYWLSRLTRHSGNVRRLFRMHDFFVQGLGISDQDIQTVSWVRVVDGLVKMQNANVATATQHPGARRFLDEVGYTRPQQRLNAETIANRLMRQTNYYVAMYNKDIFDFNLTLPFLGTRQFYSKSLEWCIDFCMTNFIFDEQGSIRPFCLDVKNRRALVIALQARLQFAAMTSILIAPFNIIRFCIVYFFRYYTEFTRNPGNISARTFTPFAEWKMREFNELDHLFQRRLRQAYPFANDYLKQFPKDKTDQACRFIAFVSGAIAAVLALATLLDPELFLGFEITPGRNTVFWLTVMVGVFGVTHGSLPDESEFHDPVLHLKDVLKYTNYIPAHWKDRWHTNEVRNEFSAMYQLKIVIFLEEILSLIAAPWILLRNAKYRSEGIVDFFREHTVHVDGVGHQCNFAVFGFRKDPNAADPSTLMNDPDGLRDDYYGLKDDKMAASMHNFLQYYSHYHQKQGSRRSQLWRPPPAWPPMLAAALPEDTQRVAPRAPRSTRTPPGRRTIGAEEREPHRSSRQKKLATNRRSQTLDEHLTTSSGDRSIMPAISKSVMMREDSDLRDYVADPSKEGMESDTDNNDGADHMSHEHAGVLGLLYEFSKAQTESKRPAVNI